MKKIRKVLAKLLTFWIPVSSIRKKLRAKINADNEAFLNIVPEIKNTHKKYKKTLKELKAKIKNGKKVRVAFFVIFDSIFQAAPLYEKMLNDDLFDPFIVIIPDISRGEANMFFHMNQTYETLSKKYENVFKSYDEHSKTFIDFVERCDLMCSMNPYDVMTHELYRIERYSQLDILTFHINYGFFPDYYAIKHIINLKSINLLWKYFADTKFNYKDFAKYTYCKGKNAVLSGYCKMDKLHDVEKIKLKRPKIIIAPHHTINTPIFPLSNFLEYHELFLELPQKYPEIDFVFRPHPLLFVALANSELWGQERVDNYIKKITSYKNVEYQNNGDYFETFVNSSAIIHDCASFVMEYLYTGHPACYMLKSPNEIKDIFAPIGQKSLANYYHAYNKEEIIKFIDNVVINNNDHMKEGRIKFAQNEIMLNYPNVSDFILEYLKMELL